MTNESANLGLPLIMPAQAQKHVTVNESLLKLDVLVQSCVTSQSLAIQPSTPEEGNVWIIPEAASGSDWALMTVGSLAVYRDGFWTEIKPKTGWSVYASDAGQKITYDGSIWKFATNSMVLAEALNGAQTKSIVLEEALTNLSGASVASSVMIPARAIVFCVSVRTTQAVSGASSFDCGLSGEANKFGGSLGISMGSSNLGVIGPTAIYSDTSIVLSANGGDFTGGEVEIAIHAWLPMAPRS